jgi:BirA family transcriptional regulator, biotin operon repressor / biotin---[acetyl-CoA-carboxylase] ligase
MAGVATVSAIQQYAPAKLKWPNDILLNGKKLAGILCEHVPGSSPAVIVGIGINLNQTIFPDNIQNTATSLKLETGKHICRTNLVISLLQKLNTEYESFLLGKNDDLIHRWTEQSSIFGKTITVYQKGKTLVGKALGLTPKGRLILQYPDGKQQILDSGEVSFHPI